MTLTFDLLTSKSIGRILDSWWVSVWSVMIIGWLQSQLSSGNHFQITMRHDLDLWPFDPKINRAHPWLMGSKCMKFHDHRWITESVIVRKLVWRTDRQTDWRTECKPIVPSGFTGGGLITIFVSWKLCNNVESMIYTQMYIRQIIFPKTKLNHISPQHFLCHCDYFLSKNNLD